MDSSWSRRLQLVPAMTLRAGGSPRWYVLVNAASRTDFDFSKARRGTDSDRFRVGASAAGTGGAAAEDSGLDAGAGGSLPISDTTDGAWPSPGLPS